MSAKITLYADEDRQVELSGIGLGEITAPESQDELLVGEPVRIFGKNTGTTNLKDIQVFLDGEGKDNVQLATEGGTWADVGMPIILKDQTILSGENFTFWVRAIFGPGDAESTLNFRLLFRGLSTQ